MLEMLAFSRYVGTWIWEHSCHPDKSGCFCLDYLYKQCGLWWAAAFLQGLWPFGMCSAEHAYVTDHQQNPWAASPNELPRRPHFTGVVTTGRIKHTLCVISQERTLGSLHPVSSRFTHMPSPLLMLLRISSLHGKTLVVHMTVYSCIAL